MTDLETLDVSEIRRMVKRYESVFYHRTVILEGIRKIAFRNMIHLTKARCDCKVEQNYHDDTTVDDALIECTQARMLSDQGLENNTANRTILDWATFYPLQLYLSLFYAEIEFIGDSKNNHGIFGDHRLESYLEINSQLVQRWQKFRDAFLHPHKKSLSAEMHFLQEGPSFNIAPILQCEFDGYLLRLKNKLSNRLLNVLSRLPAIQRLYCLYRFVLINMERRKLHHDQKGIERCAGLIQELSRRIQEAPERVQSWSPSQKQAQVASFIAQCLDQVNPAGPEVQFIEMGACIAQRMAEVSPARPDVQFIPHAEKQTAMRNFVFQAIVSNASQLNNLGNGRHSIHITENIGLYRRMAITILVLLNESVYGETLPSQSSLQITQQCNTMSQEEYFRLIEDTLGNLAIQDRNECFVLFRLIAALLYELAKEYLNVSKENPSVANRKLDEFLSADKLETLRLFRNSVFHVLDPLKGDPNEVDLMFATSGNMEIFDDFLIEMLGFWGV